jgi:hypothetical protein
VLAGGRLGNSKSITLNGFPFGDAVTRIFDGLMSRWMIFLMRMLYRVADLNEQFQASADRRECGRNNR